MLHVPHSARQENGLNRKILKFGPALSFGVGVSCYMHGSRDSRFGWLNSTRRALGRQERSVNPDISALFPSRYSTEAARGR